MMEAQAAVLEKVWRRQNLRPRDEDVAQAVARDAVSRAKNPRLETEARYSALREKLASGQLPATRVLRLTATPQAICLRPGHSPMIQVLAWDRPIPSLMWSMLVIGFIALLSYGLLVLTVVGPLADLTLVVPALLAFVATGLASLNLGLLRVWAGAQHPQDF